MGEFHLVEGDEHKRIRERYEKDIDSGRFELHSSHTKAGTLPTYLGERHTFTQMADVDMALVDRTTKEVNYIIEIEDKLPQPKYLIGEIIAIAMCKRIGLRTGDNPLNDVVLVVAHRPKIKGSHKDEQYRNIIQGLKGISAKLGCLRDIIIMDWDDFEAKDPLNIFTKEK
jgi:hypothetical protein